uniref:Uncharacterized protein n=1 Tax=Arundo donax TaxID=35708 RepID=A0A0A9AGH2_ARUDO
MSIWLQDSEGKGWVIPLFQTANLVPFHRNVNSCTFSLIFP